MRGAAERALGGRAAERLLDLLNSGTISIMRKGRDRYGRTLADVSVGRQDIGETLLAEGLARRWPDGPEFWCER
ncbi:thermonuclease family protein [Terrihabitans sp. B22-R8]|uniref:thermonuclease family protein n=1 Tax=Terrihabitans sp. B22-R8 TaxID=3425128 RepID=UPI00403C607B